MKWLFHMLFDEHYPRQGYDLCWDERLGFYSYCACCGQQIVRTYMGKWVLVRK